MFYAHFILSKKGPLARIWLAAHWDKKLTRAHVVETNIASSVQAILEPHMKMALRTSGHLMLGVVRIYSHKAKYLLNDCNQVFVKIKMSFRPGAAGELQTIGAGDVADQDALAAMAGSMAGGPTAGLAVAGGAAPLSSITLPDNIHDFETTIAELNKVDDDVLVVNQSRPEDITMRDDFGGEINLGRQDDDFGESCSLYDDSDIVSGFHQASHYSQEEVARRSSTLGGRNHGDWFPSDDVSMLNLHEPVDESGVEMLQGPRKRGRDVFEDLDTTLTEDGLLEPKRPHGSHTNGPDSVKYFDEEDDFDDGFMNMPLPLEQLGIDETTGQLDITSPVMPLPSNSVVGQNHTTSLRMDENLPHGIGGPALNDTSVLPQTATFAQPSIPGTTKGTDAGSVTGIEVHKRPATRRKRRLIIDEPKSIPSEAMKTQMRDTSDITSQLDLAPPSKKLMHWKETGGVDKLLTMPGRAIASRCLQRLFMRNLRTVPRSTAQSGDQTTDSGLPSVPLPPYLLSGATTPLHVPPVVSDVMSPPPATPSILDNFAMSMSEAELARLSAATDLHPGLPSSDASMLLQGSSGLDLIPQSLSAYAKGDAFNLEQFSAGTPAPLPPETPGYAMHGDGMDDHFDDLDIEPMPDSMLELERAMFEVEPEDDDGDAGNELVVEEKRLEKRSKVLLRMIDNTINTELQTNTEVTPSDAFEDCRTSFAAISKCNSKKQAAAKFYTLLLLRKQEAVKLYQDEPFSNITITRGQKFDSLLRDG